jgi:acetylornithine deacetylase/succinyl-diaminopimelate desuccinylase-like protein
MRTFLSYCILLLFPACLFAQSEETLRIRTIREQRENVWLQEYIRFLSIPNVAADKTGLHRNTTFIMQMMQQRNIQHVQLLSDGNAATTPAIYGEVVVPGATQTLIFYAHYDGQPVDSSQWLETLCTYIGKRIAGTGGCHDRIPIRRG